MYFLRIHIFILLISLNMLYAHEGVKHVKLPLEKSLPLLKTIQKSALHLGTGPVSVHVFVDPLCPHSRNFMEMIVESDKMRSKYSYYFYLYTLPRLKSEKMVHLIYGASDPLALMIDVMVHKKEVDMSYKENKMVDHEVQAIADVAQKLDVYKRPYMIMVKKPKIKRGAH